MRLTAAYDLPLAPPRLIDLPPLDPRPAPEPQASRLTLLYTVVFVEIGIAMPFMPVWLNALGLDARVIGALVALPIAVRIVATAPLLSLIDRGVGARTLLMVGSLAVGLTYALMPLAAGIGWPLLALLIALNSVAGAPLVPSIDYLTLAAVRASARLDYARIRLGGSIGFLCANLAGGALLTAMGERLAIPLLLTALAFIAAGVAFASGDVAGKAERRIEASGRPRLPVVLRLTIVAAALIQASHAAIYAFGSIYWSTHGISATWIGTLWATGVAAEIVLFAGIERVPVSWRSPFRLLALGGGAAALRACGMALAGEQLAALPFLQVLHAFTFGATHLGAMAAVSAFAPDGARGRAQGMVSAATALVSASATLICGVVYAQAGGPTTFLMMAPLAVIGFCLAAVARRYAR